MSTLLDAGDTVMIDGVTSTVKSTSANWLEVYGSFNDNVNNVTTTNTYVQPSASDTLTTVGTTNHSEVYGVNEVTLNGETYASVTSFWGDSNFIEKMSTLLDAGDTVMIDGVTSTVKSTSATTLEVYGSFNDNVNNVTKLDNGMNDEAVVENAFPRVVNGTASELIDQQITEANSNAWKIRHPIGDIDVTINPEFAVDTLDGAILQVLALATDYGALQNRLQYTISNLMSVSEHTVAARSRIEDADFATESAALAKAQVLQQTSAAMLAQANARPKLVLQLVK
jgi:flagellin-like hook-associated protein FlgL